MSLGHISSFIILKYLIVLFIYLPRLSTLHMHILIEVIYFVTVTN